MIFINASFVGDDMMGTNPKLYEINIRTFLRRYDTSEKRATFKDIPLTFWKNLADKGFNYIWLMGVWETCSSVIPEHCFQEGLVNSYNRALKNWTKEDVIGSPYAINRYKINPDIGSEEELKFLRKIIHSLGMKLILDFVPNHFSVGTVYKENNPDLFLHASEEDIKDDPHTFFRSKVNPEIIFAHGRDPFFPAWTDTIQLNYFNPETRAFMINTLLDIIELCDGVRCDMSMLVMNNIFLNTWRGVINTGHIQQPEVEFWKEAIEKVKSENQNFLLIAETYWDLEWELQQLGFDFTYDKKLLDRLKDGTPRSILEHLKADLSFQLKSVRFIENHDEERATQSLGTERSYAAAIIISTIQGMQLYYNGQFSGHRIKLPVQLGKEPNEHEVKSILKFYDNLFEITNHEVFKKGIWRLLDVNASWEGNNSFNNILAWNWSFAGHQRLIVVNYSNTVSQGRIKLDVEGYEENFKLIDLLNNTTYWRNSEEVHHTGLFIELQAFRSHIFSY
jgi:1,4-alpha-glucan branching enzyme